MPEADKTYLERAQERWEAFKRSQNLDTGSTVLNTALALGSFYTLGRSSQVIRKVRRRIRAIEVSNSLTPEARLAHLREHMNEDMETSRVSIAPIFDEYETQRLQNIGGFSEVKVGGESLPKILQDDETAKTAKTAVEKALSPEDETANLTKAAEEFNRSIAELNEKITNEHLSAFAIQSAMHEIKSRAEQALDEHQTAVKQKLYDLFAGDNKFKEALQERADLNAVKTAMLEELDKSHQKAKEAFTTSLNEAVTQKDKETTEALDRVAFWSAVAKYNEEELRKKYTEKFPAESAPEGAVELDSGPASINLKGLSPTDLDVIKTGTKHDIHVNKDGSFNIKLESYRFLFNDSYHFGGGEKFRNQALHVELELIAAAVKASGHSKIVMEVNLNDPQPERPLMLARAAYKACVEQGFSPEDITIQLNGETKEISELFKGKSQNLAAINNQGAHNRKILDEGMKNIRETTRFRSEVSRLQPGPEVTAPRSSDPDAASPRPRSSSTSSRSSGY